MPAGTAPTKRPRVAIAGLWHLGTVIGACVADEQWPVLAIDPDATVIADLREGRPPLFEPGLEDLVRRKLEGGSLSFAGPADERLAAAEIVWVAFDTPVDDEDRADVEFVLDAAARILLGAGDDALVVISSQLPVGSAHTLSQRMAGAGRGDLRFACVPENLRLGRGIETFSAPDRFVAGVRSPRDREQLTQLLARFCDRIEWMSVESAEMTKHALNAFLATSIAFINEISGICERVGADAADVARGLKSEQRIGPRAYLSPGDAFAGGTLARDVAFLTALATDRDVPADVARGVATSNDAHRAWARRALESLFAVPRPTEGIAGRRIGIWGLTYKPGTDTLRRSSAVELIRWLTQAGATVIAYDPAISALPPNLHLTLELAGTPVDAVTDADALVVCTPWPEFRDVPADQVVSAMRQPLVLDPAGHLQATLGQEESAHYLRVGSPLM
jgi:UDPglucose 6-dehydrogenase